MLPPPPGTEPPGGSVVPPDAVTGPAPLAECGAAQGCPPSPDPTNERFIVPSPSATEAGCTAPDESLRRCDPPVTLAPQAT